MKITKTPDMVRGSIGSGNASSIGGVIIGPPGPGTGGGTGIVSSSSNQASWQPIISSITANTSNALIGPYVNFASGSNILLSVSSNTAMIHLGHHQIRHNLAGDDAIKLDDLAAPDDNTDLNATTSKHGLLPKLGGGLTNFLRADGTWNAPAGSGGGALTLIAEFDLGSNAASMDFTSIPGTYRHLRLEFMGRSARAAQTLDLLGIRFNGDSGANYDTASDFFASGGGADASATGQTEWQMNIGAANATANSATSVGIDIPFYTDTTFFKTARAMMFLHYSTIQGEDRVCDWRNTAAITQITIRCVNADILAGSRATLYGIT